MARIGIGLLALNSFLAVAPAIYLPREARSGFTLPPHGGRF